MKETKSVKNTVGKSFGPIEKLLRKQHRTRQYGQRSVDTLIA